MADRLQAYADWLVQNQDKRGTTEFAKLSQTPTSNCGSSP